MNSYTSLQGAILTVLVNNKKPVGLADIEEQAYKLTGAKKPRTVHQSVAACIRNMRKKLELVGVKIERTTDIGRGHEAAYILRGDVASIRRALKEAA